MKKKLKTYFAFLFFFTNLINLLAQNVTLNYPSDGFVTSKTFVEICFNNQTGAVYELEVATNENFSTVFYSANNLITGKKVVANLNPNTKYFWHVRRLNPTLSAWSSTRTFTQFSISSLSNLSLWLKADTGITLSNGTVLTWNDLSINQYNLTQATANRQPTAIQNFYDDKFAIKFDGGDFFEIPNFAFGSNNSAFVVGKKNSGTIYSRYLGTYGLHMEICTDAIGLSGNVVASYSSNTPTVLSIARTPGNTKIFQNDSLIATSYLNVTSLFSGSLFIGRSSLSNVGDFLTGEIAEVIFSTTSLSDSVIEIVNHYLMDKYSKELYLGNDTNIANNFCPLTLNANAGFTNYLWSTGETTASITINNSGMYWVQAKDYFGRIKCDSIEVQYPAVNQINSQILCYGAQVIWNTGLNNSYTHLWQDNSSLNQITINTNNNYFVKITDSEGCLFYSDTVEVITDNFSLTNSLGNDTNLCFGNSIQLQNYYSPNTNYLWSNGSSNDTLVITNSGTYWLEASNQNNCIFRDTIAINIVGVAPDAEFLAVNGCINTAINFTDLSVPPLGETISQWLWDFGDGTISSLQNNLHTFDSAGIYNVSLKVILQSGCGAVYNQAISVLPLPSISYTAFNLCNQKLTEFNNTSNLFGGNLQSVLWNFGNPAEQGNTANTSQAFHVYNVPGTYNISIVIQTIEGCIDSLQSVLNIKPSPIANFTSSNNCLADTTIFTDISQIDFPYQSLNRKWQFPNGDTSFFYQPKYLFNSADEFNVILYVQSTNGCRDTVSKTIAINNKPEANFTYQNNCIGAITQFADSSSCLNCQIINYGWNINNVSQENNQLINYVFNDTGSYSVNLTILSNAGCTSFKDTVITVNSMPVSNFILNSYFGSPPYQPQFSNLSQFATSYSWDFGDGGFSQELNPIHIFNDTGIFYINLKALNNENCENTYTQILKLLPKKIDLSIYSFSTNLIGDYIESEIVVFNKSTAIITSFDLIISNNNSFTAKEFYSNPLLPGEFKTIKLNSKIMKGDGFNLSDVLCIELTNIEEGLDADLSNNSVCKAITADDFKLIKAFPNPVIDELSISFICPEIEEVFIELTDLSGNIISNYQIKSKIGYNKSEISTALLAGGAYILKVNYNGFVQSLLFVKLK
jgi:PKD repeat protein